MRWRLAVACFGAVLGMAVGCGDAERADGGGDLGERGAPATGEKPPTLPAAARKDSVAGAKAFIRYYWDAKTYAQSTGDTGPLRAAGSAGCSTCDDDARYIEDLYERGKRVKGGQYAVREISEPQRISPGELSFVVRVHIERKVITRGEGDGVDPGRRLVTGPGMIRNHMVVVYEEGRWRLDFNDISETGAS